MSKGRTLLTRLIVWLLCTLLYLLALTVLWPVLVPNALPGLVQHGLVSASLSFGQAFVLSALLGLLLALPTTWTAVMLSVVPDPKHTLLDLLECFFRLPEVEQRQLLTLASEPVRANLTKIQAQVREGRSVRAACLSVLTQETLRGMGADTPLALLRGKLK